LQFEYVTHPSWPRQAWLAQCRQGAPVVVHHGPAVETTGEWFAEAAWDGAYAEGAFDRTDVVYGTGGRRRDCACVFVSSASTVDRLNSLQTADGALVSNSLACLLQHAGAQVDATYPRYYEDFHSVVHGLSLYRRHLRTSRGDVELAYFDNLRWDGKHLLAGRKPAAPRDFSTFARYAGFQQHAIEAIAVNMADASRAHPYALLGTLSTGYDSPAVATLARPAGLREVLCFDRSHDGADDSGEAIARHLGLATFSVHDAAWRRFPGPEIPFLSSNSMGEEVRFRSAEALLGGRVLLTGYHGDKVWDVHTQKLGDDIVRGDCSGLSLTEYRLSAGFIHLPVPFLGVRQIRDINAISRSAEMQPWDVGGDYTRPICRRIVESAGVPRHLFGMSKKNASVMLHNYTDFLTPASRSDYLQWLRQNRMRFVRRGRVPPLGWEQLDRLTHRAGAWLEQSARKVPLLWRFTRTYGTPTAIRRYLFPWAVERAQERYRAARDVEIAT
jgi:hypothetical protein